MPTTSCQRATSRYTITACRAGSYPSISALILRASALPSSVSAVLYSGRRIFAARSQVDHEDAAPTFGERLARHSGVTLFGEAPHLRQRAAEVRRVSAGKNCVIGHAARCSCPRRGATPRAAGGRDTRASTGDTMGSASAATRTSTYATRVRRSSWRTPCRSRCIAAH